MIVEPAKAAALLRRGEVVAIPTDTVYGLAVDPTLAGAADAVFALKGRPESVALPVLVADEAHGEALADPDGWRALAAALARSFWPGALTLVVRRRAGLHWALGGDASTVGIRCPASAVARALLREVGPLAVTSANRHGGEPCHSADEVEAVFGAGLAVVDGGTCAAVASTVVDCTGDEPRVLRVGAVDADALRRALAG